MKVKYYDINTDSVIERECLDMEWNYNSDQLQFTPSTPTIFKTICIDHPQVTMKKNYRGFYLSVTGYQMVKSGGYWKTTTNFRIEEEE